MFLKLLYKLNHYGYILVLTTLLSIFMFGVFLLAEKVDIWIASDNVGAVEGLFWDIDQGNSKRSVDMVANDRDFSFQIYKTDFRSLVIDYYLELNNSPLAGLGRKFVESCDKYGAPADCTVVVGIAKAETDLCNYGPSQQQKNCWGFGGAGSNRYIFNTYSDGIDLVTDRLVNRYGVYYMINPNAMEMTYCGNRPSCATWGEKVQSAMNELNSLSSQMGYAPLYSLR